MLVSASFSLLLWFLLFFLCKYSFQCKKHITKQFISRMRKRCYLESFVQSHHHLWPNLSSCFSWCCLPLIPFLILVSLPVLPPTDSLDSRCPLFSNWSLFSFFRRRPPAALHDYEGKKRTKHHLRQEDEREPSSFPSPAHFFLLTLEKIYKKTGGRRMKNKNIKLKTKRRRRRRQ